VNSHVFLSEGCRLIAFCLATVDGAHFHAEYLCYLRCLIITSSE